MPDVNYIVLAYNFEELAAKPKFLALRYCPEAAIRCTEEFRDRWPYPYYLVIEEEPCRR